MLFSQLSDFQKIGYLHCRFTQTPGGLLLKLLPGRAKAFLEDRDAVKNVKKRQFHPNYDDCKSDTPAHLPGGGASLWNLWSVRSIPTIIFVRTYKVDTNFSPIYTTKNKCILKKNSKEGEAAVNAPLKRGLPAQDASKEIKKIAFRLKKDQWKKKIKETPSSVSNKKEIFLPPTRTRGIFVPRTSSNDLVFDSNPVNQLKRQITKKKIENFAAKSGALNELCMRNKGATPIRNVPSVVNTGNIGLPSPFFFMEEARDNLSLRTSYSYPSKKDKSNVAKKVAKRVKPIVPDNDENIYPSPKLAEIKRSFDGSTSIVFNSANRKLDSISSIKTRTENIRISKIIKKVVPTKKSNENLTPHFPSPIFNQEFVDKLFSDSTVQKDVWPLEMPIKSCKSNEKQIHLKNSLNRNETTVADNKRRQLVGNSTARNKLIKESSDNISGKMVVENHLKTLIEGIQNEEEKGNTDKLILEAKYRINSNLWPLEISTNKSLETYENQNYQNKAFKSAETLNVDINRKYDSTTRNKLTEDSANQQNVKAALYLYQKTAADKVNQHKMKDEYEEVKISFTDETNRLNSRLWSLETFNDKYPGFYKNQSFQNMTFRKVEILPADGVRRLTDTLTTRDKLLKESYTQQNVGGAFGTNQLSTLGNCNQDKQKAFVNIMPGPNRNQSSQSIWRKIETLYSDGVSRRQLVDKSQTRNNFLNQSPNIQYTCVATKPNPPVQDNSREIVEKQENNKTSNNASRNDFFAIKKSIQSSRNTAQKNELTIISNLSETTKPDTQKQKLFTWTKLKSLEVQNYCNSQMSKNNTGVQSSKSSKTILRPSEEQNVAKSTLINESTKDSNLILWNLINANLQVPQKLLGSQKQDADSQSTNKCNENSNNSSTTLKFNEEKILDDSDCNERKNVASQNNEIYDQELTNKESDEFPEKSNADYFNQIKKSLARLVASDDKSDPLCKTTQPKFEEVNMINHTQSNSDNVGAETFGTIKEVGSEPISLSEDIHTLNQRTSLESNETQNTAGHYKVIDKESPTSVETLTQFEVNHKGEEICLKQKNDPNKDQEDSSQSDNPSTETVTLFQLSNSGAISNSEQNNLLSKLPDQQALQTTTQEASFGANQINNSIESNEQYCKMKVFPEVACQQDHQLLNQGESCKTDQKNEQINYQELSGNSSTSDNSTAIVLPFKPPNSGACSKSEQNNFLSKLPDHQELQTVPVTQGVSFGVDRINKYIEHQEHYYKMKAYPDVTKQQDHQFSNQREDCKSDQTNEVINYQELSGKSSSADNFSTAIVQQSQPPNLGTSSKSEQNILLSKLSDHQELQTVPVAQEASFGVDRINKYIESQEHDYKMKAYPDVTIQQEHQLPNQRNGCKTDPINELINYQELSGNSSTAADNSSTAIILQFQPPNLGATIKSDQNNILCKFSDQQELQTVPVAQEASLGAKLNISMKNKDHHYYKMNATFEVICQEKHQLPNQGESCKTDPINELINNYEPFNKSINSSSNMQPQSSVQKEDLKIDQIGSGRSLNEFKNAFSEISSQQLQLPIEIVSSKVDKINQCIKNQELDSKINEIKGLQLASSSNKEITELTNQLIKPLELDNKTRVFPEIRSLQPQSPVHDVSSSANKKHEQIKNNGSICKKEASVKIPSQKEFQLPCQGLSLTSDQTNSATKVGLLNPGGNTRVDGTNNFINKSALNNKDPSLVISKMEPSKEKERSKINQRNYMEPNSGFSIKTYTSEVPDKQNQMPRYKKLSDFWPSGQTSHSSKHPGDFNEQNKYIPGKTQSFKNHQSEGCENPTEKKIEKSAINQIQYHQTLPKLETRQSFNLLNDITKRERAYKTSGDKSSEKKEVQNNPEKSSDAMSSSDKFDGNNNGRSESSNSNNDSNRKNLRNSYYHIGKAAHYLENVLNSVDGEKKREKLYFGGSIQRDETVGEYTYAEKDRFVQPTQVKQDDSRLKYKDPSQNINNKTMDVIRSRLPVHKDKSGGSSPNNPSDDDNDDKRKSIYKLLEEISSKSDLTNSSGIYSYEKINQLNNKTLENKGIAKDKISNIKAPAGVNVSTTQEINKVRTVKDPSPINAEEGTMTNKDLKIVNESKDIKSKSLDWFQQLMNRYNSINIKEESNRINVVKEPSLRGQEVSDKEKLQIEFYNKSSSTGAIDTIPPNLTKNSNPFEWEKQKQISDWSSSISFPSKYHSIYESSKVYPPTTESHALPEHLINMDVNNYSFQRLNTHQNTHQNQNHGGYNFNRGAYNNVKGGYNVTNSSRGGYSHSKPIPNKPSINKKSNDFSDEFNASLTSSANSFNFSQLQPRIGPSLLTGLTKHISDYFKKIVNQRTNIRLDAYESLISSKPSKSKIKLIESTSTKRKQIFEKSLIPILSKNTFNKMAEPLSPIIGKINQKIDGDYMKSVLYDNTMKSFSKAAFARRVAKTPTPANISITGGCPTCDKLSQFSSNIQKGVPFMKTKKRLVSCNFCKGYRNNKRDDKVFESTNTAKEIYNNAVRMFSRSDDSPLNYITKSRTGVGSNGTKYSYRISKSATFADTDSSSIQSNVSSSSISEKLCEEASVKNNVKTSDLIINQGKRIEKSLSNIGNTLKKSTSIYSNLPDTKTATIRKPDVKYSKKPSSIKVLASRMVSKNNAIKNPYKAFSDVS